MNPQTLLFSLSLLICATVEARAQGPATPANPPADQGKHRMTRRQITELRRVDDLRQDEQAPETKFSMPGSARGRRINHSEILNDILSKMSRRDRQIFFGLTKSELKGQEQQKLLEKTKDLVYFELEVTETDRDLPLIDVDADGVPDQVDALRYSGSEFQNHRLCGPTIVLRRNQKLIVNLKNSLQKSREPILEWTPDSEPPEPPNPPAYWMMDAPHELFSTNLHTHGLHVSPGAGHDNCFLDLPPTDSDTPNQLFLDYELPANHVAGTFWYHAHRHGSVAYQLANGMAGALIVLGDSDPHSKDLESIREIQAANQIKDPEDSSKDSDYGRVLLLQQLVFTKTSMTTKGPDGVERPRWIVDPADVNDRKTAPHEKNIGRIAEGIPENKPDSAEVLAVNGQNAPTIKIQRGQIERWRLIHAGRESALNLAWYNANELRDASIEHLEITPAIESYEIATDGIPTGQLRKKQNNELYPGYRSDVLVHVTDKAVDGEYWLMPSEAQRLTRTHLGPVKNSTPVVKLVVEGNLATPMNLPPVAMIARLRRPPPDVTNAETVYLNFTFADKQRFGVATVAHGAGKPYAETGSSESISISVNTPQVWTLGVREFLPGVPEAVKHPFHMHINPFYVPSLGVWKDTLTISRDEAIKIHFIPTDYAGRSVLHCHILDHEDQGMMKDINIVGSMRSEYPDLYQLERVPEAEQVQINGLSLKPNKNNVLVFVTGLGCPHCAQNLIKFWKRSDPLKNLDANIKCMSETPLEQRDVTKLGMSVKEHFTFQNKPKQFQLAQIASPLEPTTRVASTEESADYTPRPITHGVLIFDMQQRLRYRYLGDRPLTDLDEITYALMELKEGGTSFKGKFHGVSHPKSPQSANGERPTRTGFDR